MYLIEIITKSALRAAFPLLILVPVLLSGCATSDPAVSADISAIRTLIDERGSQETKDFHADIRHVALPRKWPTAFLLMNSEEGLSVHITAGIRQLLLDLAEISLVADDSPVEFNICRSRYAQGLFQKRFSAQYRSMSSINVLNGYDADIREEPGPFFINLGGICKKYGSKFPIDKSRESKRDAIASALLKMIYLHETGHKIYNEGNLGIDYGLKSKEEHRKTLKRSRSQEVNADLFAVKRWVELHDDPMQVLDNSAFVDWHRTIGGTTCRTDKDKTHASGDVRALLTTIEMRKLAKEAEKYRADPRREARIDNFLKVARRRLEMQNCTGFE